MIDIPRFSAVIFDMDGLVLDTETTYRIAWQSATRIMGFDLNDDFFRSLAGLQYNDVERLIIDACGSSFVIEEFRTLSSEQWHDYVNKQGIAVKEGFFELLQWLQQAQIPFCLATNSLQKNTEQCLRLASISDVFDIVVSRDQVELGKPAPDLFLRAAELMQQPISECLVLEDSSTGIKAAIAAGAMPIFIPEENKEVLGISVCQVNSLTELVGILVASKVLS